MEESEIKRIQKKAKDFYDRDLLGFFYGVSMDCLWLTWPKSNLKTTLGVLKSLGGSESLTN